jgi:hypothetical protein
MPPERDWRRAALTDPQLWVPVLVLLGGLAVLVWVHG